MAKCPKAGGRVCFRPNPAARMLYDERTPRGGNCGTIVTVPVGGGRRPTCMPGPRGGLVYVSWDGGRVDGVFRADLVKESTGKALGRSRRRRR